MERWTKEEGDSRISTCLHRLLIADDVYLSGKTSCLIARRSLRRGGGHPFLSSSESSRSADDGQRDRTLRVDLHARRAKTAPFR